jgi:hypothetical protein
LHLPHPVVANDESLAATGAKTLEPSDANSIDGDSSAKLLMVPAEVSQSPTPTTKGINEPPPMLKNADLDDVVLRAARSSTTGEDTTLANAVAGVELPRLSVPQLRMLCSQWNMKKHRTAKKEGILELIATHQKMRQVHNKKEKQQKLSKKEELQGSKMRLLNVVFSDDFFESVVTMNDAKLRAELDAGGAGSSFSTHLGTCSQPPG